MPYYKGKKVYKMNTKRGVRYYIKMANGQRRFISTAEGKRAFKKYNNIPRKK